MAMAAQQTPQRTRLGIPIVPQLRCANPRCQKVLTQRFEPWRGDPEWIYCRACRKMNRVSEEGVWLVAQAGDMQPIAP